MLIEKLLSPVGTMSVAYTYILCMTIMLHISGFYQNNNFFRWGPPITFFQHEISTQKGFYLLHLFIFFHQIINNWVNSTVYSWIINTIQNPKSSKPEYSKKTCIFLVILFDIYSQLDTMLILMGFTSQISFVLTLTFANILTSSYINYKFLIKKEHFSSEENFHVLRDAI